MSYFPSGVILFIYLFILFIYFWPCHAACGILVLRPGIESMPPAVGVWSLNHWTAKEVPGVILKINFNKYDILKVIYINID